MSGSFHCGCINVRVEFAKWISKISHIIKHLTTVVVGGKGKVSIDNFYQAIAEEALASAQNIDGRLLVYSEIEDGVVSADLFYVQSSDSKIRFRFGSSQIKDLIVSFWEAWRGTPGNREWRVMTFVIEGGAFNIDFNYPDQIDEDEDLSDRRPRVIKRYFGDSLVDYSNPR